MLKIFNDLETFFQNNYKRINVREYARIRKISPPSASTLLNNLKDENLLKREDERIYNYFMANRSNKIFIDFLRAYWSIKLKVLIEYLDNELLNPLIILFGSFSKAEIKNDSDIDLAIFTASKKTIDIKNFEKKIGRKIQIFRFKEPGLNL